MEQDWAQMCYLSCLSCLSLDSVAQTAFAQRLNTTLTASWNTLGQELLQGFGTWLSGQHTKKNGASDDQNRQIKIWPEMPTSIKGIFNFIFGVQTPSKPSQVLISLFVCSWTLYFTSPALPNNCSCFNWSKIESVDFTKDWLKPLCNGETSWKLAHRCVHKNIIYWAVRTKQKPNCTLSKRGIRYFSNKSSAFLLLSNKSNSHWRNSCLSRRLSYKLAK